MTRSELEHIVRAAGEITRQIQIVVIGSQAILGSVPNAGAVLLASMEADLFPLHAPELADETDGAIGEGSLFHEQFGYYAHGVGPETATLPEGRRARLVSIRNASTCNVEGLCLEVHDLAIAKYVAGREKDLLFTRELARQRLTHKKVLGARLAVTSVHVEVRTLVRTRIGRDFRGRRAPSKLV